MKSRIAMPVLAGAVLFVTGAASTANATCIPPTAQNRNQYRTVKKRVPLSVFMAKSSKKTAPAADGLPAAEASIAGMWFSGSVEDGEVLLNAFELWNSDGTQILNDQSPILAGNVCLGAWTKTGPLTYSLKHPSWIYDDRGEQVVGIAWLLEKIVLDPGGDRYTGDLRVEVTDLEGNVLDTLNFKLAAQRITADNPSPAGN